MCIRDSSSEGHCGDSGLAGDEGAACAGGGGAAVSDGLVSDGPAGQNNWQRLGCSWVGTAE
eukprot:4617635-Alexandrium_andersonii.AAC.1